MAQHSASHCRLDCMCELELMPVNTDVLLMLTVQAQTFYDDLGAVVQQLTKMETHLATTVQVGLLPETLRVQQRHFMVCGVCVDCVYLGLCRSRFSREN